MAYLPGMNSFVLPYRPATAPAAPIETRVPLATSALVSTVVIALVLFLAMLMIIESCVSPGNIL